MNHGRRPELKTDLAESAHTGELIFGGFAVMALGQPIYALLVLVVLKISIDLHAHQRERRVAQLMVPPETPAERKRPP